MTSRHDRAAGRPGRARLRAPGPGRRRRQAGRHRRRRGDPPRRRGRGGADARRRRATASTVAAELDRSQRRRPPTGRERRRSAARRAAGRCVVVVVVWVVVWAVHARDRTRSSCSDRRARPTCTSWLHRLSATTSSPAATPTRFVAGTSTRSATSLDSVVDWLQQHDHDPRRSRGRCRRSAGSASSRSRPGSTFAVGRLADRDPGRSRRSWPSASSATGRTRMDTLIITVRRRWSSPCWSASRWRLDGTAQPGRSSAIVTPILDVMQTMPSFVYLLPVRRCSSASAPRRPSICTLIYALPPVIRIAGARHPRRAPATTLEATDSLGPDAAASGCARSQLPMAKRTIIVGVNQTMMAALSMVTIAAFVDGPGLGQPVLEGLQPRPASAARSWPACCIVVMAIMLDRTTTAASERVGAGRSGPATSRRRLRRDRPRRSARCVAARRWSTCRDTQRLGREFPGDPDLGHAAAPTPCDRFATGSTDAFETSRPDPGTDFTERVPQPAAGPDRRVAVVRDRARDPAAIAFVVGGCAPSCRPSSAWPGSTSSTSGTTRWSR